MTSEPEQTVGAAGESAVLREVFAALDGSSAALVGPGDDAAVLAAPGERVVVTTDTLVHGPDFRLAWSSGTDLGWKAAAVNLADVAAMGARPVALFVALAVPADTEVRFVGDLALGLRAACDALAPGCAVEGGDLTISDTLTVAVTAVGVLDAGDPVRRSGARPGEVVAIAGDVGRAAAGLAVLFDRFRDEQGEATPIVTSHLTRREAAAVQAQLRPRPPIASGPEAAAAGATAMMDVSDGLALDARRLATASGVTISLTSAALGPDPVTALEGGEDHALLATFRDEADLPDGFRVIGEVRPAGADAVLVDDLPYGGPGGWDPYRDWDRHSG
ncbi:thiamine-phosphate kinase [Microbacterium sp. zg.Y625]|uniref:thiamine-phosphate kinase n=1 Tax=Microbacterium jiangjiandongii TaxID=3049071 RepID=UPI00214AD7B8|nr:MULTISPECIES: thiamine-phosphate kinase [unclassified Microbacterium]MCR2792981.1 thiamine-phosphate kinase [Microbacterium sp. zg.Y625]MCR2814376.1 thiamine-phosphate kinase [Microbacterium sp. zg.Y843]WIM24097.1 thiamine-phosphate kinase [Microbacterium sp. zg-Y625]